MVSPRAGDLLVVRLSPDAAGILTVAAGDDHRLHSPYNTVEEALHHARQMAATLSVDVWHRTSPKTFDLIASYRSDVADTRATEEAPVQSRRQIAPYPGPPSKALWRWARGWPCRER